MTDLSHAFDPLTFVRPDLRDLPVYVPSRPKEQPARIVRLDMNESPCGPSPKTLVALQSFHDTHRYPDFGQTALRRALSEYTGVPTEQIIAGAGLDDVMTTFANLVLDPGDAIIIHEPTFGLYRVTASHRGADTIDVPLTTDFQLRPEAILAAITPRTKFIVICTPNNPTGNLLDHDAIVHICENARCLVVIDEAYAEFGGTSYIPFVDRYPNVVVMRTMSKFAGLAGMRVGYGLFPKALMPYVQQVVPPFHNVSVASTAAVIASLQDLDYLRGVVSRIIADRDILAANLREIPGVTPFPSATNFLLVRLPVDDAGPIVEEMGNRGVMIRHFARPELGIRDCLRVSIGTTEENEIFLQTLIDVLREQGAQP